MPHCGKVRPEAGRMLVLIAAYGAGDGRGKRVHAGQAPVQAKSIQPSPGIAQQAQAMPAGRAS